jgi:ribosome-associated translation inhibitor RaiA
MDELVGFLHHLVPPGSLPDRTAAEPSPIGVRFPLEVVFRHGAASPPVREFVEEMASKLDRLGEHVDQCRVVIDGSSRHGGRKTRHQVRVHLRVGRKSIVVKSETAGHGADTIYLTIHNVFGAAHRRLRQYVRKLRSPGRCSGGERNDDDRDPGDSQRSRRMRTALGEDHGAGRSLRLRDG